MHLEPLSDEQKERLEASALEWESWASKREAWADTLESIVDQRKPPENPYHARQDAVLGRRVAQAQRLSIEMGEPVCSCHMRPVREMLELEKHHAHR